jgi:hypothetical protein
MNDPMHDEDDESWDSADAALRLARKGYAGGGEPVVPGVGTEAQDLATIAASVRPDISNMGLFSGNKHGLKDLLAETYRQTRDDPSFAAGATGLPSLARSVERVQEPGVGNKVAGAGEILSGAIPALAGTRVAGPLFSSVPRTIGTLAVPQFMQDLGNGVFDRFVSGAHAEEPAKSAGPTEIPLPPMPIKPQLYNGAPRSKAETMVIQNRLLDLGYGLKVDGVDSAGTRNAELDAAAKQYKSDLQDYASIAKANAEAKAAAATQAETARKTTETATAATNEATRKADFDRLSQEVLAWKDALRIAGPYAALALGAGLGTKGGSYLAGEMDAAARARTQRANDIMKTNLGKDNKKLNEVIGDVNQFAQEGTPGRLNPADNPFVEIERAKAAPWWRYNPDSPSSADLYPPRSKAGDYGALAAKIGGAGLLELGPSAWWLNETHKEVAQTYKDFEEHPSPATRDVWENAKTKEAIASSLLRLGFGAIPAAGGTGAYKIYNREYYRPDVSRYDELVGQVRDRLQTQADTAAAARASQKAKAQQRTAQAPGKEGNPGPGSAGRGGGGQTRSLLPIATGLGLGTEGSLQSPSDFETPPPPDERARGGIVGRALRIAKRFASGGAVHEGAITQVADGGRTDTYPTDVRSGAYVIPADVISGLGEGDTGNGYRVATHMFGPHSPSHAHPGEKTVPIMAAGGEFVVSPAAVARVGRGDMAAGHDALDAWVKMERRKTIQKLRKLPGPQRD